MEDGGKFVVANSSRVCRSIIGMCTTPPEKTRTVPGRATDLCFIAREFFSRTFKGDCPQMQAHCRHRDRERTVNGSPYWT